MNATGRSRQTLRHSAAKAAEAPTHEENPLSGYTQARRWCLCLFTKLVHTFSPCWCQPMTLSARQKVSDAEAIRILGLGTWRLRGHMGPLFEGLAAQIEGAWRHKVPGLGLGPLPRVRFTQATLLCSQRCCSRRSCHSMPWCSAPKCLRVAWRKAAIGATEWHTRFRLSYGSNFHAYPLLL